MNIQKPFHRAHWQSQPLTAVEFQLLKHLASSLPEFLRSIVEAQFEAQSGPARS